MRAALIQRTMGLLLVLFSAAMLPPLALALLYRDGAARAFFLPFLITLGIGLFLWFPVRRQQHDLRVREGFVVVTLFWTLLALFGALPFALAERPEVTFTDAFFESMSGLTTTGATVLTGLDHLPASIRFYRQELQWLGGMGIVVLAVAILPILGVGGMQLYRAEVPGPIKDTKLAPRIAETAKALWYIYLGLTVACALCYWLAGMTVFDAVGHSFSTVATGGFSTHDESLGYFRSSAVNGIAVLFMCLGAFNFALHFHALQGRSAGAYVKDEEVRTYLWILLVVATFVSAGLVAGGTFSGAPDAIEHAVVQVVSAATTTGFTTTGFHTWPPVFAWLLLCASFIGGCAGSTTGGIKVIRGILLYKQGIREIQRLLHPEAVLSIKVGRQPIPADVMSAVWGFLSLYVVSFVALTLAMIGTGLDLETALSSVVACLHNLGPGLGEVSATYAGVSVTGKWLLCFAMLMGRLELFTFLALLMPSFWRD